MDIGLSSACFYPDLHTENSIGKMKELGFNHGEIFLNTWSEYSGRICEGAFRKKRII